MVEYRPKWTGAKSSYCRKCEQKENTTPRYTADY